MELLFEKLNAIRTLSSPFKSYLTENCEIFRFEAHQYALFQSRNPRLYFVSAGLSSADFMQSGNHQPVMFFGEGDFIPPSISTYKSKFIHTLKFYMPTVLLGITIAQAKYALRHFPEAPDLFLGIADHQIASGYARELFLRMPVQDRYNQLFTTNRQLFKECSSQQLAAYLNISQRQLMRLKQMK